MLNKTSVQLALNLAMIAEDRKIDLTPKTGSLMEALSTSVKHRADLMPAESTDDLVLTLQSAANGEMNLSDGKRTFEPCAHDTLMDNYIVELAQLVGQHVNFARQVVLVKIKHLEDATQATFGAYPIKEAEDFFDVRFYKTPDVFKSTLIEDEVLGTGRTVRTPEIVNFGEALADFDPNTYFVTGDEDIDALVRDWISQTGADVVRSYIQPKSSSFEATLFGPAAMDYHLANFLLYRNLNIKQDLKLGVSALALTSLSATNRDYHATQLAQYLNMYKDAIETGLLLTADSQTNFSYLSSNKFSITIYEESFAQLTDVVDPMEKIFGAIASGASNSLTVQTVKEQGDEFIRQWKSVRGLYTSYLVSTRSQLLKTALKLALPSAIELDVGEDKDSPIFDERYRQETFEMATKYIDSLQASDADDLYKVCMELMGRVVYRFSNAYFFLREMYEILEQDDDIDVTDAAHAASVRYITDFLLEQLDVGQKLS